MATLWRRAVELRQSDANVALRHAAAWLFRRGRNPPVSVSQSVKRVFALMLTQYPIELGVRMTIKPLLLLVHIQRWIERPLAALARRTLLN